MRRSNWKSKLLIVIAVLVGILAGVSTAIMVNKIYSNATGLAFFGTLIIVAGFIILIGVKIFRIGRD
jgi:uncharacterized membrane protein YcjF (UPF0283 family)